ncbi:MAG: hypothetical protein ISQ52_11305 [Synechococcus sp. BS307-5m-G38]|nr:hypothetical protein [Synechococcus sp. BS307-5m-G38]
MVATPLASVPAEETLINALRGCRDQQELKDLEQRLAEVDDAPPLFDWICDLLVKRRLSRILAAQLLRQLHQS